MKKGFTLVEMLIVVVVLVTLMSITFRLTSLGEDQTRRNNTIARIQRLENCLSGYYAAFGTYPPVALHGERNINLEVEPGTGIQRRTSDSNEQPVNLAWYDASSGSHGIGTTQEEREWRQVRAACYSQPIAVRAPVPDGYQRYIDALMRIRQKDGGKIFSDGYSQNAASSFSPTDTDWRDAQLFQFGVLSFLLPRYLIMLNAGSGADIFYSNYAQWTSNNTLPANQIETGSKFSSWQTLRQYARNARQNSKSRDYAMIANIPSQAVCARWLPNLEKACLCLYGAPEKLFGIEIAGENMSFSQENYGEQIFGQDGNYYILSAITVVDGWRNELYYYSPKPYQGYVLWSSGPNQRTFPPWISRETLSSQQNKCVAAWTEDDIVHMSN